MQAAPAPEAAPDRAQQLLARIVARNRSRKQELGLDDKDLEVLYSHACSLLANGEDAACERAFLLLAYVDPYAQRHWLGLGASRERLRRYPEAIEAFSMAAQLGDRNPLIPLHAAQCHLALGLLDEARAALDDALAWHDPADKEAGIADRVAQLRDTIARRMS